MVVKLKKEEKKYLLLMSHYSLERETIRKLKIQKLKLKELHTIMIKFNRQNKLKVKHMKMIKRKMKKK